MNRKKRRHKKIKQLMFECAKFLIGCLISAVIATLIEILIYYLIS